MTRRFSSCIIKSAVRPGRALGRSPRPQLSGRLRTIRYFTRRGIVIRTVINNFTFDGAMKCAVRDALIGFMAATADAQAEATKVAQRAGIDYAMRTREDAYLGRKPSYTREQFDIARALLGKQAAGIAQIAKDTGLNSSLRRFAEQPGNQALDPARAGLLFFGLNKPRLIFRFESGDHPVGLGLKSVKVRSAAASSPSAPPSCVPSVNHRVREVPPGQAGDSRPRGHGERTSAPGRLPAWPACRSRLRSV